MAHRRDVASPPRPDGATSPRSSFSSEALGGAATLALGAIGFLLAVGRYDVGAYLWIEGIFVFATIALGFLFFARSARPLLARLRPLLSGSASSARCGRSTTASTTTAGIPACSPACSRTPRAIQAVRVLAIWAAGKAVGIELGPRIYYVMGPLFFLVLLVPFTLNGIAVREAFFVSFLGSVGVPADTAFAAGFLFFLVTTLLALPGALILLFEGIRGGSRPRVEHG